MWATKITWIYTVKQLAELLIRCDLCPYWSLYLIVPTKNIFVCQNIWLQIHTTLRTHILGQKIRLQKLTSGTINFMSGRYMTYYLYKELLQDKLFMKCEICQFIYSLWKFFLELESAHIVPRPGSSHELAYLRHAATDIKRQSTSMIQRVRLHTHLEMDKH